MKPEPPDLSPVPPGQSALSAFLPLEQWARARLADARAAAAERLAAAEQTAAALRDEAEARLREAVTEGEQQAVRSLEAQATDRVGDARRAVEAWIGEAEQRFDALVAQALDQLITADVAVAPRPAAEPEGRARGAVSPDTTPVTE